MFSVLEPHLPLCTPADADSVAVMDTDAVRADLGSGAPAPDSLACVTCRSRKLKCDRVKPVCTRCTKAKADCVYPESRRKPAFKRRNVKELEERLGKSIRCQV